MMMARMHGVYEYQRYSGASTPSTVQSFSSLDSLEVWETLPRVSTTNLNYGFGKNYDGRSNVNGNDGITIKELKIMLPLIFKYHQDLATYFHEELFFASNLRHLATLVPKLQGGHTITLEQVNVQVNSIMEMIDDQNQDLHRTMEEIKSEIKLTVFTNVSFYKNLNNAQGLIQGLLKIKTLFQNYMTKLSNLDDKIIDLTDQIEVINDDHVGQDINDNNHRDVKPNNLKDNFMMYTVNNNLDLLSNDNFETTIHDVMRIFEEIVRVYRSSPWDDDDIFVYEIILFDDHLKTI